MKVKVSKDLLIDTGNYLAKLVEVKQLTSKGGKDLLIWSFKLWQPEVDGEIVDPKEHPGIENISGVTPNYVSPTSKVGKWLEKGWGVDLEDVDEFDFSDLYGKVVEVEVNEYDSGGKQRVGVNGVTKAKKSRIKALKEDQAKAKSKESADDDDLDEDEEVSVPAKSTKKSRKKQEVVEETVEDDDDDDDGLFDLDLD